MGILKDIWNTIFGKSKKQDKFSKGGDIFKPEMNVVYKKNEQEKELEVPNSQVCNDVQENVNQLSVPQPNKKRVKYVVGQKTLSEIKDYLLNYGSIDTVQCKARFGVKSLRNFIWQLRKDGLKIKTNKISLLDELGQKTQVTFYTLISKK